MIPQHLEIMRSITGTVETPGAGDNPAIMAWPRAIAERYPDMASYCANYTHDEIAWCGLTVAYCMAMAGIRPVFGPTDTDKFLWAQAWKQFGTGAGNNGRAQPGDVVVFARHVSLLERFDGSSVVCRGGNQSDQVKESSYPASTIHTIRRPPSVQTDTNPDEPAAADHPLLKFNSTGPAVTELQMLLGIDADGEFGPDTDAAVRAFQRAHGLDDDGEVGPDTWDALTGPKQPGAPPPANVQTSKGSWYSQYDGKYHWHDGEDKANSAALGVPDDAQGIARPQKFGTLGTWFAVRAPNGKVSIEQQTDHGPGASTGRTIDISAVAAERFGYSPTNFPTDSIFTFWPVEPPKEVAGLSKQQQATRYRDLRKERLMPDVPALPPPVVPRPIDPPDQHPEIKMGATGAAVIELQKLLSITQSGFFDFATDAAVRAYQASRGLVVDGEVGPASWDMLLGKTRPSPVVVSGTGVDVGRWVKFVMDHQQEAKSIIGLGITIYNNTHPKSPLNIPGLTPPAPTGSILDRPSVQLGGIGAILTGLLYQVGTIDPNLAVMGGLVSAGTAFLGPFGGVVGSLVMNMARGLVANAKPK